VRCAALINGMRSTAPGRLPNVNPLLNETSRVLFSYGCLVDHGYGVLRSTGRYRMGVH
jgi:hypothetical protein